MMNSNKSNHYLFTALLLICSLAHAQTPANGWVIENIHGPSQLGIVDTIAVDINQDGLMDVVSASIDDGHLRAYINQGQLNFEQQYISTDILGAYRVTATDLNSDNQTDFLIPSIESQEIIALIADSSIQPHGYRKQIIAENILLPTDAQAGDFNADGLMDVVSTSFEENLLILHLQNSQGGFDSSILSAVIKQPRKLVVADFNNDQHADILVASSADHSVRLFSNDGGALFSETLVSDQLIGIRSIAKCGTADTAYPGFVAGVTGADQVLLFVNNADSTFSAKVIDDELPGADAVHCANLNQDPSPEIISISRTHGNIYTYQTTGSPNKQLIANSRDGYITTAAAAFAANAQPLVLTQAYFENRNLAYTPQQSNQEAVIWEDFPDGASSFDTGDMNGDGVNDIVVSSFRDDKVQWYDGVTNKHHLIAENIDGAAEVIIVDLDDDGKVDVISAASFADSFYWHRNKGNDLFETITIFDNALFANGLAVGDLNADGQLDVVGTSGSDDSVRWFNRNGEFFNDYLVDVLNDGPNEVKIKDMNGDGTLDLVVPYTFSNNIYIYYNQGNSNFQPTEIVKGLNKVDSVVISDLNYDGLGDLIVSVARDGNVLKLVSHLNSMFLTEHIVGGLDNPKKLYLYKDKYRRYLLVNHYIWGYESFSVYSLQTAILNPNKQPLFQFINVAFNLSHVFKVSQFDLIYKNSFE